MQRIGPSTAEIKRMYVKPEHRRSGHERQMLEELIDSARARAMSGSGWIAQIS